MPAQQPPDGEIDQARKDQAETAESVFQHVKMLWDDQVSLAETIRDKRRVTTTLLAVLLGLGIFRLDLTASPDQVLVVRGWTLWSIRTCVIGAMLSFVVGSYFLFTERPVLRVPLLWLMGFGSRCWRWLYLKARAPTIEEADAVRFPRPPATQWPSSRAIHGLLADAEDLTDWLIEEPTIVKWKRAERLREAYKLLRTANRRVRSRITLSMFWVFLGYVLVFCAMAAYILGVGRATP